MLSPEYITAICAVVTLFIYFTVTMVGAVIALFRKIDKTRETIMNDVNAKHQENRMRVDAMQELLIRHDTQLNPYFNGSGSHAAHST